MNLHRLVIFDLDGTLFRAETVTVPAVQQAFEELRLPAPDPSQILQLIGSPVHQYHDWLSAHCPAEQANRLVARADELELAYIATAGQLYEGVLEALAAIQSWGFYTALCSNGEQRYVDEVVRAHRLQRFFHAVRYPVSRSDLKSCLVKGLLEQFGAWAGVLVGDRQNDVEAAHSNGLRALGATYGYGSPEELLLADAQVASARELPAAIRALLIQD
jgi:phosphoglycolate phosphatase-like HAD superfamily hydrolase